MWRLPDACTVTEEENDVAPTRNMHSLSPPSDTIRSHREVSCRSKRGIVTPQAQTSKGVGRRSSECLTAVGEPLISSCKLVESIRINVLCAFCFLYEKESLCRGTWVTEWLAREEYSAAVGTQRHTRKFLRTKRTRSLTQLISHRPRLDS